MNIILDYCFIRFFHMGTDGAAYATVLAQGISAVLCFHGRSTRIWLDHILKTEIGKVVDWSKVDKEDYLLAMERSPIKDVEIKVLLKAALSDEINSREVYLSGIDQSYYYEGYTTFEAENLSKE